MIISRTPFRISFVGGGTDLRAFYKDQPGAVLSTSINQYIYLSMHKYFYRGKILLKYRLTEEVKGIEEIKHPIIREVFKHFEINDVDLSAVADIPAGTGMGSSSAFTSGLIKLCSEWTGSKMTNEEIAQLACEIEIGTLKEPIGKQDQYACAIGGLNLIVFSPDETVEVKPLFLPFEQRQKIEGNLHLFFTGQTRVAADILTEQQNNTNYKTVNIGSMKRMASMAFELYDELSRNNVNALGHYMNEGWQRKKELASGISNSYIDHYYDKAISAGATGGKLLGAGGGGFLLFYCEKEKAGALKKAMADLEQFPFKMEEGGSVLIFKDQIM